MSEIRPTQPYTVSYFITDPFDSTTYYCRVVVLDTTTGEVLETHDLTQTSGNSHLFSKRIQAPGDSSGHGRKITVIGTAYTDSGYTTKAPLYQEQAENYLVIKESVSGGGGFGIDYTEVQNIVRKEIAKIPKPEKIIIPPFPTITFPEQKEPDFSPVLSAIEKLPQKQVELKPVFDAIQAVKNDIGAIEIPQIDVSPIVDKIAELGAELATKEEIFSRVEETQNVFNEAITRLKDSFSTAIKDTFFNHAVEEKSVALMAEKIAQHEQAKGKKPVDITKLIG